MVKSKVKAEIQALSSFGFQYLSQVYLPKKLKEMGIMFLGPEQNVMYILGDKIASTILAQSAGVPVVSTGSQRWSPERGLRTSGQ